MQMNAGLPLRALSLAFAMVACLGTAACSEADDGSTDETAGEAVDAQSAALIDNGGGFTEGGGCKVTSGTYSGSTGTYDEDGWCCFGLVCVECTDANGGSRCSDAATNTGGTFPGTIFTNPGPVVVFPTPPVANPWTPIGGGIFFP